MKRVTLKADEIELLRDLLDDYVVVRKGLEVVDEIEYMHHSDQWHLAARLWERVTGESHPDLQLERFERMVGLR